MFEKLQLKLTLINVGIIALLFLLLIGGAYSISQIEMNRKVDFMTHKIADEINAGIIKDFPRQAEPMPGPNIFFAKTDTSGSITFISGYQPLERNKMSELVQKAQECTAASGEMDFDQRKYYFVKSLLTNQSGSLVVFQDLEHERRMLHVLLFGLTITGIICLILSYFGSLFLANRAMTPIKEAWRQQREFLADASHELRTPLAVIQTTLDVVRDNPEATIDSQKKWLNNIAEETSSMAQLVESLLFLARSDTQNNFLEKRQFILDEAIICAAHPFQSLAVAKKISLVIHAEPQSAIYGDESKLKQVIGIILDNAIRHTPDGGSVTLQLSQNVKSAIISITDTGVGIGAEHLPKIFDRFYQVDSARSAGGSGLGLSIAKAIVKQHGGNIQVSSILGSGTTFTIQLPFEKKNSG